MYETYFGLSGAPFLLNPDPSFYFDSKGHNSALAYLKFGLYQAEGFIVITGDIGAGKTTLVRTLLSDIDTSKVVAAQLVSTQLEAGDLLRSTLTAFGVPIQGNTKAELIATLEAYLTLLATQKKRAVLIVDEAQNLSRDAIEELRMLSNFQFGNQALLQSFLIGQPELRDMLLSRSLEQLRQRVIASYHLGPIARDETRRYIEHRLSLVGWQQDPRFDDDAFDEIFQWTSGIPRRINLLCNRLLLATYLNESHDITAATVAKVAMEIRAEIGEPTLTRTDQVSQAGLNPLAPPPVDDSSAHAAHYAQSTALAPDASSPAPTLRPAPLAPSAPSWQVHAQGVHPGERHVLLIISSRAGAVRAAALHRAFAARNDLPALRTLVIQTADRFELTGDWCEHMGLREPDFSLRIQDASGATQLGDVIRQLDHLLGEYRPAALMVQGGNDGSLAAALVAHRQQIPLVHLEGGLRSFDRSRPSEVNAMMCDHAADLLITSEWVAHDNLAREGVASDRVHFAGNLIMDTIRSMLPQASPPKYTLRQFDLPAELLKHRSGYGVVYLEHTLSPNALSFNQQVAGIIKSVSRDLPLLWVCSPRTQNLLDQQHLLEGADPHALGTLPIIPYFKMIGLVGTAACVFTDSTALQEESTIMGVPCLTLQNYTERRITVEQGTNVAVGLNSSIIHRSVAEVIRGGGKKGRLPKFWDGMTASRVADVLSQWVKQQLAKQPAP